MKIENIQAWIEDYIKAWNSNEPGDITKLFSAKSRYYTAPYREPWLGREQIVKNWLGIKDEPGDFEFRYEIIGLSEITGFIRGWTKYYKSKKDYSNLWIIKLNEQGECQEFIEWWMEQESE